MASRVVAAKTERLLNLVIALLSTRVPLAKERIRLAIPQYQDAGSLEAFDRMFERDKDELRELGIPLITAPVDPLFDDELGYRIDRRQYALPEIRFEPDEITALALAGRAWAQATLAGPAADALRKLRAAGVDIDDTELLGVDSRVRTAEPAFEPLRKAVLVRQPVRFDYRKAGEEPHRRTVNPWALVNRRGHWYLSAYDLDRADERVFRVGRIVGPVRAVGAVGSYEIPDGHVPHVLLTDEFDASGPAQAIVDVREGRGHRLRERASTREPVRPGWVRITLSYADSGRLADELAWYGGDVIAVSPPELRSALTGRFEAALATHDKPVPA